MYKPSAETKPRSHSYGYSYLDLRDTDLNFKINFQNVLCFLLKHIVEIFLKNVLRKYICIDSFLKMCLYLSEFQVLFTIYTNF